jgi:hypothetical protein
MHFLSAAQVASLAEVIRPPYGTLVYLLAYGGLCWGRRPGSGRDDATLRARGSRWWSPSPRWEGICTSGPRRRTSVASSPSPPSKPPVVRLIHEDDSGPREADLSELYGRPPSFCLPLSHLCRIRR